MIQKELLWHLRVFINIHLQVAKTDTAYTLHWYDIKHLIVRLQKLQYTEQQCCCTTSSFIHELWRKISTWNEYKFSVQKLQPSRDSLKLS